MSVYKEGFHILSTLGNQQERIYPDACDYGIPVKSKDKNWNAVFQLISLYGVEDSRIETSLGVSARIEVIDEWAVSDETKTIKQATEQYLITYTKCRTGRCFGGYDGFISIVKLN